MASSAQPLAAMDNNVSKNGEFRRYTIALNADEPDCFKPSDEEVLQQETTGTTVTLDYVLDAGDALAKPATRDRLTQKFALYLSEYPSTGITFDGKPLTVDDKIVRKQVYPVPLQGDSEATVTVIEWAFTVDGRKLYLCNANGSSQHDFPLKLHAPGIQYTAYFRSKKVQEWADANLLGVTDMEPSVQQALDAVKGVIRAHNAQRASLDAADVVAEWKEQEVYPYTEGEENDPIIAAEQQVFNAVAVQVHSLHPTFSNADTDNKRLTLSLIRRALESDPSTLLPLLQSFMNLPEDEKKELASLLEPVMHFP